MIPGDPLLNFLWLVPLGLITGLIASMVGLGGGFIIVPVLMTIAPDVEPGRITSLSLAVIILSSFSGSIEYAKQKRIDFRQGILFALAGIPGIAFGSWVVSRISRGVFDVTMGTVMMTLAVVLLLSTRRPKVPLREMPGTLTETPALPAPETFKSSKYRDLIGATISTGVGFISTVLGIGGGVIHVPAMIYILRFTPHRATATSQFILACMATFATILNFYHGRLSGSWLAIIAIGSGMIVGAQFGAKLSKRMQGYMLIRVLAGMMLIIGARALINTL